MSVKRMQTHLSNTALILSGGGARAAYQVGVLLAIAKLLPKGAANPFPIICGTSAGGINAVALAAGAARFRRSVFELARLWQGLSPEMIYHASLGQLLATAGHWLLSLFLGGLGKYNPRAFLNNAPLRDLLVDRVDFSGIQQSIEAGALRALSISASGYTSGQSVSFFQGAADLEAWHRASRVGVKASISVDHLMASAAIPLLFPAVRLHREFFGDGTVRQIAPISPAIHLGAERILVIGVAPQVADLSAREKHTRYPTLAQVMGHLMNSIFLDSLDTDLERLTRINHTLASMPAELLSQLPLGLRPIKVLAISPSQPLERLAIAFKFEFPVGMRFLLGGMGAFRHQGSVIASYLLFCSGYSRKLIELGYRDAMEKEQELRDFLSIDSGDQNPD
ncbi:MAG: patatin-like phospholipase family protein [Proteobacteria bacterium]|nr:patatin-like phospholipase family protein [Pseudomonadota bacterium]